MQLAYLNLIISKGRLHYEHTLENLHGSPG